uniref:Uncharacterized protein n=1 Tax=Candidatus Kentrum sp. DK TaxID=2126562 RepID=A0A450SF20_9GAMM|nr:MAG: hypothetical protein BECKDK2373B_GA0170837_10333 [Candidatus Kentron sp. DK]
MIRDWYFCASIKLPPDRTKHFLTLLSFLDGISDRPGIRTEAIGQLTQLDPVLRIYAFSRVLAALRASPDSEPGLDEQCDRFFKLFLQAIPAEIEGAFARLFKRLLSGDTSKTLDAITSCAEQRAVFGEREATDSPYLDMEMFMPEDILVSVCESLAHSEYAEFSALFKQEEGEQPSPIRLLMEDALALNCGRHVHMMAIGFAVHFSDVWPKEQLTSILIDETHYQPDLEPDALYLVALVEFGAPEQEIEGRDQRRIVHEILKPSVLHRIRRSIKRPRYARRLDVMSYLGLADTPDLTATIGLIFWQAALWEWLVENDPQAAAKSLAPFWKPRTDWYQSMNLSAIPDRNRGALQAWQNDLQRLFKLSSVGNPRIEVKPGKKFIFPRDSQWMVFSPWLDTNSSYGRVGDRKATRPRYPDEENRRVLIRLIASTFVTTHLLIRVEDTRNPEGLDVFAAFLLHAADVLSVYSHPLDRERVNGKSPAAISEPLEGLALAAQRIVTLLACGAHTAVKPERFLNTLEQGEVLVKQQGDQKIRDRIRVLFDYCFPEVLTEWLQEAAEMGSDESHTKRWEQLLSKIDNSFQEGTHWIGHKARNPRTRVLHELVYRFLGPNEPRPIEDATLDWRSYKKSSVPSTEWWGKQRHRTLLIGTEPDVHELLSSDDVESQDAKWVAHDRVHIVRLTLAVQRLHALAEDIDPNTERVREWVEELETLLHRVASHMELDRFLRLRMIELLGKPFLDNHPKLAFSLFSVLIEYGSALDYQRISDVLNGYPEGGRCWIDSESFPALVLTRMLSTEGEILEDVDDRDVWQRITAQDKRALLETMLCQILHRESTIIEAEPIIHNAVSDLRRKIAEQNANRRCRAIKVENSIDEHGIEQLQPDPRLPAGIPQVSAAGIDINNNQAWLYSDTSCDPGPVYNLFDMSQDERTEWTDASTIHEKGRENVRVYAVVMSRVTKGQNTVLRYNIGLPRPLEASFSADNPAPDHKPGTLVICPIFWGDQGGWRYDRRFLLASIQIDNNSVESLVGQLIDVTIQQRWDAGKGRTNWDIRIDDIRLGELDLGGNSFPYEDWFVDTSTSFRFLSTERIRCRAIHTGKGIFRPVAGDFIDLLLEQFPPGNSDTLVVLTLVEIHVDSGDQYEDLLLMALPGQCYRIPLEKFSRGDRKRFQQKFAETEYQGLLVCIALDSDGLGLQLVDAPNMRESRYPLPDSLIGPFDRRNILWRNLFADEQPRIVEKDPTGRWTFILDEDERIPGFPETIAVKPVKSSWLPKGSEETATAIINPWNSWGQHQASAAANFVQMDELRPDKGGMESLLKRIEGLSKGDRIQIKSVIGQINPKTGFVRCLTEEGLVVDVAAESLTMELIDSEEGIRIGKYGREAEVTWVAKPPEKRQSPEIATDTLPSELQGLTQCRGTITSVPARRHRDTSGVCTVYWNTKSGYVRGDILIENLARIGKLTPGMELSGARSGNTWTFEFHLLLIRAEAIWSFEQEKGYSINDGTFLGLTKPKGRALLETGEGQLIEISVGKEIPTHLGLPVEQQVSDGGESNDSWRGSSRQLRRCCLRIDGSNRRLAGQCDADKTPGGRLRVDDVDIQLRKLDKDHCTIRREFLLSSDRIRVRPFTRSVDKLPTWEEWLNGYLHEPHDLIGNVENHGKSFRLDSRSVANCPSLDVHPDEGAFIPYVSYPSLGIARIFETSSDEYAASFRRVDPQDVEEIHTSLGAPEEAEPILLKRHKIRLFYVGKEEANPITKEDYSTPRHRFEFGYGKTWLIPEEKLRYRQKPISTSELTLFVGDRVTQILFFSERESDDDGTNANTSELCLSIEETKPSLGHSLYLQAKEYRIIHILHLIRDSDNGIHITRVDGFNEHKVDASREEFIEIQAELRDSDRQSLEGHWKSTDPDQPGDGVDSGSRIILGRLDHKHFLDTLGATLRYEHVRLSFNIDGLGSPLRNDEKVLFQAGNIRRLTNDVGLELNPLKELHGDDIGEDFPPWKEKQRGGGVLVLRRRFSIRQDMLTKLKSTDESCLNGKFLFAKVSRTKNHLGESRVDAGVLENVPPRTTDALKALLGSGEERVFANVVKSESDYILLELRPGAYIRLERRQISSRDPNLIPGAVVLIQNNLDRSGFDIHRAIFGDLRYLQRDGRLVVVLPKNELLRLNNTVQTTMENPQGAWKGPARPFSIGDLPDGEVGLLGGQGSQRPLLNRDITGFMTLSHPKIAALHVAQDPDKNSQNLLVGRPLSQDWWFGCIEFREDKRQVHAVPIGARDSKGRSIHVPWHSLSFEDGSIENIRTRMERETWIYHDEITGYWSRENEEPKAITTNIEEHSVFSGPIFFKKQGDRWLTLRYHPSEFLTIGLPVETLLSILRRHRSRGRDIDNDEISITFPVAGFSTERSIWIETVPGRLVELPLQICVNRFHHQARSLGDLWPRLFAPGDKVELSLARSRDLFSTDRIVLKWSPGPRAAFGNQRCLLPRIGFDEDRGSVAYGAGIFALDLPSNNPQEQPASAYLLQSNRIVKADTPLKPGDVVLIGLDTEGQVFVHGANHIKAFPHLTDSSVWMDDPLGEFFISMVRNDRTTPNWVRVRRLIDAAGGAVPVTVEFYSDNEGKLSFSRRVQRMASLLPEGALCPAFAVGYLAEEHSVLVRLGANLTPLPLGFAVPGVPAHLHEMVANALVESREPIWVRGGKNSELTHGWEASTGREFVVEPLLPVGHSDNPSVLAGILCRTLRDNRVRWLPTGKSGWAQLNMDDARRIFGGKKVPFRVRQIEPQMYVSVSDVHEIAAQFDALKPGNTLAVEVLTRSTQDPDMVYVRTTGTGILLECHMSPQQEEQFSGKGLIAEISTLHKAKGSIRVTSVQLGTRRFNLDLPHWMLDDSSEKMEKRQTSHYWRLENLRGNPPEINPRDKNPSRWGEDELESFLYVGINHLNRTDMPINAVRAAKEWAHRMSPKPTGNFKNECDLIPTLAAALLLLYAVRYPERITSSNALSRQGLGPEEVQESCEEKAILLLDDIGRRALRSLHIEIMTHVFWSGIDFVRGEPEFIERIRRLRTQVGESLTRSELRELATYAANTPLRANDGKALGVANAVLTALGLESNPDQLLEGAPILSRLVAFSRAHVPVAPFRPYPPGIFRNAEEPMRELEGIFWELVTNDGIDLTLLSRLPDMAKATV